MESSSIITQVHRDEGNFNNNNEIDHLSATRLSKPRSVLRSLLCCFGLRRRHHQHHHEVRNGDLCSPQSPHQPSASAAVTKNSPSKLPIAAGSASNGVRGSCQVGDPADSNGRLTSSVNGSGVSVSGGGAGGSVASPPGCYLLPPVAHKDMGKICIVIDLDETLVHSSFKPISSADFIVPVEIDGAVHQVYVLKRPHVDKFLQCVGQLFECVLFTASLAKYADPVADLLDKQRVFGARLFRESCVYYRGNYVKDLQRLGRDLRRVIIVDNSPASYIFHPDNAVAVKSWFDDMSDTELLDCLPLLERLSRTVDVYAALANGVAATSLPSDDATIAPPVAPPVATN